MNASAAAPISDARKKKLIENALKVSVKFPVFPCGADKAPVIAGGFHAATKDPEKIKEIFSQPGAALVGTPTGQASGFFVVDFDPDGLDCLAQVADMLPVTRQHKTRRGVHYLFNMPAAHVTTATNVLAKGVDIRGDGGYVIFWPATLGASTITNPGIIADAPEWLLKEVCGRVLEAGASTTDARGGETFDNYKAKTNTTLKEARQRLALLDVKQFDDDYDGWRDIGAGLHHQFGADGLELWDEWSRGGKYPGPALLESKWESFGKYTGEPTTIRWLLALTNTAFRAAKAEQARAAVGPFDIRTAAEVGAMPPIEWLIDGLLPAVGAGQIYAEPGAGKTFLALDLAAHVALGRPWNGRDTKQGRVLYVCAEGTGGIGGRLRALAKHHGVRLDDLDVLVLRGQPNLLDMATVGALIEQLMPLGPFVLSFVDTVAQVMAGGDENAGKDMGLLNAHLRMIGAAIGGIVVAVHHPGKDISKGARGWSGTLGGLDVELAMTKTGKRTGTMRTSKLKDGNDDQQWGFELVNIETVTVEGKPDASLAVRYTDVVKPVKTRGLNAQLVYDAVMEVAGVCGGVVSVSVVLDLAVSRKLRGDGPRDARRSNLNRELQSMAAGEGWTLDATVGTVTLND